MVWQAGTFGQQVERRSLVHCFRPKGEASMCCRIFNQEAAVPPRERGRRGQLRRTVGASAEMMRCLTMLAEDRSSLPCHGVASVRPGSGMVWQAVTITPIVAENHSCGQDGTS